MFSRISGVLFIAYVFTFVGGVGYLISEPPFVGTTDQYMLNVGLWGWFYVVGGLIAAAATALRPFLLSKITSFWYFEISGISLIISANLVHAYSLYLASVTLNQYNLLALTSVLVAFSAVCVARVVEIFGLIRYLKQYAIIEKKGKNE